MKNINLDQTALVSTTALSAASTSADVIYSTTARANVPFRIMGFMDITEPVAGTWSAAPTKVQPSGPQTENIVQRGYSFTPANIVASRAVNTTYYNTSNRVLLVIPGFNTTNATGGLDMYVNDVAVSISHIYGSALTSHGFVFGLVKPGQSYKAQASGTYVLESWIEIEM